MSLSGVVMPAAGALILARWAAERRLDHLNRRSVLAHSGTVPEAFKETIDAATYAKSVEYTLAKARFGAIEATFDMAVLAVVLFSGVLPRALEWFMGRFGESAWAMAAFLFGVGVVLSLPGLPFAWHAQFRLEERFGFNTTTPKVWWLDRLKGFALAVVLGFPLLALILKLVEWIGPAWWLWAWGCVLGFELVMVVLAPVLIMPLFNKFTPLPEGSLRGRLLALADRTGFRARSIQVMDGSKRSRHSNAFFTGFGRFRKIVLFDTLMQQLSEPQIEAVLAHEIGHYKKRHIPKMLAWSAASLLGSFYIVAWLSRQAWFYQGFGFAPGGIVPALLLSALLGGTMTFWFSPVGHWWSRRHEYEADAFAAQAMKEAQSLIGALRKIYEKNLANLTPHPLYSGFYYSHPTLSEREKALLEGTTELEVAGK
jgi:STE24 endopeptidase